MVLNNWVVLLHDATYFMLEVEIMWKKRCAATKCDMLFACCYGTTVSLTKKADLKVQYVGFGGI